MKKKKIIKINKKGNFKKIINFYKINNNLLR